nr:MAG TPA: hypothetical protein [Caudoviricetes sp.]
MSPRRDSAGTVKTTDFNNQLFCKGSFSLQPSISKAIPLASRADHRRELA